MSVKYITNEIFPHGLGTRMFLLTNAIGYSIISGIEFIITPFSYQTNKNEFISNQMTRNENYIHLYGRDYESDCISWDTLLNLNKKKITDIEDLSEVLYLSHPSPTNMGAEIEVYNKIRDLRNEVKTDFLNITPKHNSDVINVGVHIRRGDIIGMGNRFIDNSYYINNINILETLFKNKGVEYEIIIYTQKVGFVIDGFENFKIIYDTDKSSVDSWNELLNCDIILGSNSAFSTSVGMLTDGVFIHPIKSTFPGMDDWLYGDELTDDNIKEKLGYES